MAKKQHNAFKSLLQHSGQTPAPALGQGSAGDPTSAERQAGRRSRAGYTQVAAYIPEALYKKVKVKLLQEEPERNFSELMEELLTNFVARSLSGEED